MISRTPQQIKQFSEIFTGAKTKYGNLSHWDKNTGKKLAFETDGLIPYEEHLKGQLKGLSPVNEETQMCSWGGIDVDLPIPTNRFPGDIWSKIGTQYFCFLTPNKRWRVLEFFEQELPVEQANKRMKELETSIAKKLSIKVDEVSTVPTIPSDKTKVGRWFFLPYSFDYDVCYSPGGNPLSLNQFFFRYKYRAHPIVVASVGMTGKGEVGSRSKTLFEIALYKRHFDCDVSLEELNKHFQSPLDELSFKAESKHVLKTSEKYDQKYFLNCQRKWMKEITGHRPCLDAKGLVVIEEGIIASHIYVQSRVSFFETKEKTFLSKEQINDWWKTENPNMSGELLKNSSLTKVRSYLTHPGITPGVVYVEPNEVKGFPPGEYLNIYQEPLVKPKKGEFGPIDDYYSWLLGEDNWLIEKQKLAFILNAKEEHQRYIDTGFGGLKIQWFSLWHSLAQGVGKNLFAQIVQTMLGTSNVRTNVKFDQVIEGHSTIIDGAQMIFLNEVALNNTAHMRDKSERFKDMITEPEIMVNPKFRDPIAIPNLCNFYVFSNSDKSMYIEPYDRRAFVININKSKEQVGARLEFNKEHLLKATIDPSAFMYHLLNDITYDREMFFGDAPMTKAKEDLIYNTKDEFTRIMEECFEEKLFPFHTEWIFTSSNLRDEHWFYNGFLNTRRTYFALKKHPDFKHIYFKLDDVERFLKDKSMLWPNGKKSLQLRCPDGTRPRVYLLEDLETHNGFISEMTDKVLGELYYGRKTEDIC